MTYHVPVPAPDVAVCAPAGGLRHASLAVHHHPLRSQGLHFPLASEVVLVALTEQTVLLAEAWLELREEHVLRMSVCQIKYTTGLGFRSCLIRTLISLMTREL